METEFYSSKDAIPLITSMPSFWNDL